MFPDFPANNALLKIVYESSLPDHAAVQPHTGILEAPAAWRHRGMVSLEHLEQTLTECAGLPTEQLNRGPSGSQRYPILSRFLRLERELRHLRRIPDLVTMLNTLHCRYTRNIGKADAVNTIMKDVYKHSSKYITLPAV